MLGLGLGLELGLGLGLSLFGGNFRVMARFRVNFRDKIKVWARVMASVKERV